ncbi:hypothetical protein EVAR_14138_1 [Eumeta japonica]|uniref:Uncharacterized protein n=1 Tax=Eumeta variegata TaxID=151549 RepID=A0A4C1UED4_EUMVA|nr:hypothetical protein EVAR_14138_1 [Eumeta japonica]
MGYEFISKNQKGDWSGLDPTPILVIDPSPVLYYGNSPFFYSDPSSVLVSISCPVFNSDFATNHISDFNEVESTQFLHFLYFDTDQNLNSDADPTLILDPGLVFDFGPGPGSRFCSSSRFES